MWSRRRRGRLLKWFAGLAVIGSILLVTGPALVRAVIQYWGLPLENKDQVASVAGAAMTLIFGILSVVLQGWEFVTARKASRGETAARQAASRPRWVRPSEASPQLLRVHRAPDLSDQKSEAPSMRLRSLWKRARPDSDLPPFVQRDVWPDLVTWANRARSEGGFLLLVGTSSVGKTRLLHELARLHLSRFRILVPELGDGGAINALAEAGPDGPTIVWLDELQRFLPGPYYAPNDPAGHSPVTAEAISRLLHADTPVIVLAALWPLYNFHLRNTATDPETKHTYLLHPQAVDVLNLVTRDQQVGTFSTTEREAAAELARCDTRLARAVADRDYNVTEALAGAPQIMRRYRQAMPEHRAVIHAAADARRFGVQSPLTRELLRDAARSYLTASQTDDTWFDTALAELTRSDRRDDAATAPLVPISSADRRIIHGYTLPDYLLQHLLRARRSELLPESTWHALIHGTHDRTDLERLGLAARSRSQFRMANLIYIRLFECGHHMALSYLVNLAKKQRNTSIIQNLALAESPDQASGPMWEEALVTSGAEQLRTLAEACPDNDVVVSAFVQVLADHGELNELRALADTHPDNRIIVNGLARALADQGALDQLHDLASFYPDEDGILWELAQALAHRGELDQLRALADTHPQITWVLADALADRGRIEELRYLTDRYPNNNDVLGKLARALAKHNELVQLRVLADAHPDSGVIDVLANALADRDELDQLRGLADTHSDSLAVARGLARVLADRGELNELRALADTHPDNIVVGELARALADHGELDELRDLADTQPNDSAVTLLTVDGVPGYLRAVGSSIEMVLAETLAKWGDRTGLWQEVHSATSGAVIYLSKLLFEHDDYDAAENLLLYGLNPDGSISEPWELMVPSQIGAPDTPE